MTSHRITVGDVVYTPLRMLFFHKDPMMATIKTRDVLLDGVVIGYLISDAGYRWMLSQELRVFAGVENEMYLAFPDVGSVVFFLEKRMPDEAALEHYTGKLGANVGYEE